MHVGNRTLTRCQPCIVAVSVLAGRRQNIDALPTMGTELNSKRKAAQAAVHAAAQALAQEDGLDDEGFGLDEGQAPAPYMPTLPPGMQTSAGAPQVGLEPKLRCMYEISRCPEN